ncbi:hypothetical protein [Sorangium sp. So ce363]|uniref:hypothetical protein n=1 Tax=Sorangium sp. So ce363 TaxID=3133304 RepID=UPI003F628321
MSLVASLSPASAASGSRGARPSPPGLRQPETILDPAGADQKLKAFVARIARDVRR